MFEIEGGFSVFLTLLTNISPKVVMGLYVSELGFVQFSLFVVSKVEFKDLIWRKALFVGLVPKFLDFSLQHLLYFLIQIAVTASGLA